MLVKYQMLIATSVLESLFSKKPWQIEFNM
jgi:hypothetical protein